MLMLTRSFLFQVVGESKCISGYDINPSPLFMLTAILSSHSSFLLSSVCELFVVFPFIISYFWRGRFHDDPVTILIVHFPTCMNIYLCPWRLQGLHRFHFHYLFIFICIHWYISHSQHLLLTENLWSFTYQPHSSDKREEAE